MYWSELNNRFEGNKEAWSSTVFDMTWLFWHDLSCHWHASQFSVVLRSLSFLPVVNQTFIVYKKFTECESGLVSALIYRILLLTETDHHIGKARRPTPFTSQLTQPDIQPIEHWPSEGKQVCCHTKKGTTLEIFRIQSGVVRLSLLRAVSHKTAFLKSVQYYTLTSLKAHPLKWMIQLQMNPW